MSYDSSVKALRVLSAMEEVLLVTLVAIFVAVILTAAPWPWSPPSMWTSKVVELKGTSGNHDLAQAG